MKWVILENLSTTTKMELCLFVFLAILVQNLSSHLVKGNWLLGGECKDQQSMRNKSNLHLSTSRADQG